MYLDEVFGLSGKTAVVTGAGRGIGQVVACGLAKAGAEIVIISRSGAEETVDMITKAGGKAYDLKADVTKEDEVDAAVAEIMRRSGKIDILFNNAGICIHKGTLEASIEEWRSVIDINLTGEYIMARAVGRTMIEKGIQGSIVNMASMSGTIVNIPQWQASYNASKAGVIHLTKSLAAEWIGYGIRVNSLSPGYIATPMSADVPQELKDAWEPLMPMHRMGKPEELIPAVLYLVSPAAGYTTGADVIVDGGYTCI
ncbi:MAG: SDR family oxidoreductase [Lachnospiraceae bacterium]|nr:SDR family oxidoreductase [Robinsoniella sp.]MDY3767584.1 SDR family oxidoreductase [Lachnospiraceae bacterium]